MVALVICIQNKLNNYINNQEKLIQVLIYQASFAICNDKHTKYLKYYLQNKFHIREQ